MDKQVVSSFQFDEYKVDYIRYDLNSQFEYRDKMEIDFDLNTKIGISEEDMNKGKVTLIASIFEKPEEKNYPFSLEVSITGYFSSMEDMTKEEFIKFLKINGTATIFPFLRSVIADVTRTANIDPLVLPLINIHNLTK